MITINCNNQCLYENDGLCTLTHVTSVSEATERSCAYFKSKVEPSQKNETKLV